MPSVNLSSHVSFLQSLHWLQSFTVRGLTKAWPFPLSCSQMCFNRRQSYWQSLQCSSVAGVQLQPLVQEPYKLIISLTFYLSPTILELKYYILYKVSWTDFRACVNGKKSIVHYVGGMVVTSEFKLNPQIKSIESGIYSVIVMQCFCIPSPSKSPTPHIFSRILRNCLQLCQSYEKIYLNIFSKYLFSL